jgi:hypothetical protein
VEEQAAQPTRRGVSSSHDTVQSVVLLRPRTIWLITAIIAGLAAGWVVVGHVLDVWALRERRNPHRRGSRPHPGRVGAALHRHRAGRRPAAPRRGPARASCPAPSPCSSSTASCWPCRWPWPWRCWCCASWLQPPATRRSGPPLRLLLLRGLDDDRRSGASPPVAGSMASTAAPVGDEHVMAPAGVPSLVPLKPMMRAPCRVNSLWR